MLAVTVKGIIFDLDNTLLRSNIDFAAMKHELYAFFCSHGILSYNLPLHNETCSTIIHMALMTSRMTERLTDEMWKVCKKHEVEGMLDAALEPGVSDLLERLAGKYRLAIVTNNAYAAAQSALEENDIGHFFDLLVCRENMQQLKPSPDGFRYVLQQFVDLPAHMWISVGDAWVDGKASEQAGIRFIAYRADMEKMSNASVTPDGRIDHITELLDHL